ncbi:hypothetical protein AB0B51_13565 [Streptomyces griseus]|uniref:hypothetical protein n=1 Tax=Streptomyces griseus TaxID=1911 RepID=UPI0033F4DC33
MRRNLLGRSKQPLGTRVPLRRRSAGGDTPAEVWVQPRLDEFRLRTENWTGLVVVYAMDKPEPRGRLSAALEEDGFEVTERRNEYGVSLEIHLRDRQPIHTRYDFVVNTIAEVLPEAATYRSM